MFRNFNDIEEYVIKGRYERTIALAGSHDLDALSSVVSASRKNIVNVILIGNVAETKALLLAIGEPEDRYTFIEEQDGAKAARRACELVHQGKADIPMKGKVMTADFMRAIFDKQFGFVPQGGLLSEATVMEFPDKGRLMVASDCAVNISPDYAAKKKILIGAVKLAHQLGIERPRVAVIAPLEVVNTAMPSTIDAAMLAKDGDRGQFPGCLVDGPLALDVALDKEAAAVKGVGGEVAGMADILIMPDLGAGNTFTKSLHYLAHIKQSGNITGSVVPIVMTSRTDTAEDKYYSILVSVLQSLRL